MPGVGWAERQCLRGIWGDRTERNFYRGGGFRGGFSINERVVGMRQ